MRRLRIKNGYFVETKLKWLQLESESGSSFNCLFEWSRYKVSKVKIKVKKKKSMKLGK